MRKLWKWLFETQNKQLDIPVVIHSITCGERDENGFADTYVNGEKTNVRMLLWTEEEIERLHKIADKIHKENGSK
jgi:hypothetical protein